MSDRPNDRSSTSPFRPHDQQADDERSYTIDELTAQAGVTVRTVRYYVSEGLLPPPHGAGPGTRYTPAHLDRLLLIGALKDAYWPLKEIRRRIAAMSDAEIHETVERMLARSPEPVEPAAGNDRTNVDAVASTVLMASPPDQDRAGRSSAASDAAADAAAYIEAVLRDEAPGGSMHFPGANEPVGPVDPVGPPDAESSQWRRLAISPEAELLIEESTYRRRRDQIEALIVWARRILTT